MPREAYLGDGVYASAHDGDAIALDLRGQDDSRIVLEPEVLGELVRFARQLGWRLGDDQQEEDR